MGLADDHAVRLVGQARADDLRIRILGLEPKQDRIIGRDCVGETLLEGNEAVGALSDQIWKRGGGPRRDRLRRRRAARRAHSTVGEIAQAARRGTRRDEHSLAGVEVDGGEINLLEPLTGDRGRIGDDIDASILDGGKPLGSRHRLELDAARIPEDRLGQAPQQVDLEALEAVVQRVEVREQQSVLIDAGDQVPTATDAGHEAAARHRASTGQGCRGTQTGSGMGAPDRRCRPRRRRRRARGAESRECRPLRPVGGRPTAVHGNDEQRYPQ